MVVVSRTDAQLEVLAGSVRYSFDMMRSTVRKLKEQAEPKPPVALGQAPVPVYSPPLVVSSASPAQIIRTTARGEAVRSDYDLEQTVKNALLDSFLSHSRRTYEFLMDSPKGDDGSALHFVRDRSAWERDRARHSSVLSGMKVPINKHHSHLTYTAVEEGKLAWGLEETLEELEDVFETFLNNLEPIRRSWFESSN